MDAAPSGYGCGAMTDAPTPATPVPPAAPTPSENLRARVLAVTSLLAVVVATLAALTADPASSGDRPPAQITEVRAAEQALADALRARDGAVATGEALRAARSAIDAIDGVVLGPLNRDQRANLAARRDLVEALGSVLRNPRSPLADELDERRAAAEAAAERAGVPIADLSYRPAPRRD